jgi:hypothetical protein
MKTITRGPRGLGQLIFLAVLFALVADATAQQPPMTIRRDPSQLSPAARRLSATLSTKEPILTCERR